MIVDCTNLNACLLHDFARYRFFNRLPLIHETRQGRVPSHLHQAAAGLAQQAAVPVRNNCDNHRVGPGIVFGVALWAPAHLSSPSDVGRVAAHGTEAVSIVPAKLSAGLGNDPGVRPAHVFGGRPGVLKGQQSPVLKLRRRMLVAGYVGDEVGHAIQQAEEYWFRLNTKTLQFPGVEPGESLAWGGGDGYVQVCHRQHLACRVLRRPLDPFLVAAFPLAPVKWIGGVYVGNINILVHNLVR